MVREHKILKCPFCGKGDIEITYTPPSTKTKSGPWGGSKADVIDVSGQTIIHTKCCPKCGKTNKEIMKNLEGEEDITKEDRKKIAERFKKQGLPTEIKF
jgi:hypothetical protein